MIRCPGVRGRISTNLFRWVRPARSACVEIHRSHSLMINILASLCFIGTHSQPRLPWALSYRAGQTVKEGASAAARQRTLPGRTINKLLNKSSSLYFIDPPAIRCICAAVCPLNRPNFDADSADSPQTAWLGVCQCQGCQSWGTRIQRPIGSNAPARRLFARMRLGMRLRTPSGCRSSRKMPGFGRSSSSCPISSCEMSSNGNSLLIS